MHFNVSNDFSEERDGGDAGKEELQDRATSEGVHGGDTHVDLQ